MYPKNQLTRIERVKKINPLVAIGLTLDEIASKLHISRSTVKRDLGWQYDRQIATGEEEIVAQVVGLKQMVNGIYGRALAAENEATIADKYHYQRRQLECIHTLAKLGALDRYIAQAAQSRFNLLGLGNTPQANTPRTIGPIQIVYGPSQFPDDNSDTQVVIDLPVAPDDRAACDPATVQVAAAISELKRQAKNGSDRTPGREE